LKITAFHHYSQDIVQVQHTNAESIKTIESKRCFHRSKQKTTPLEKNYSGVRTIFSATAITTATAAGDEGEPSP
jgi:hypothetical protein